MKQKGDVRVRFAPSPTGAMHIGNLRSALYNFLFARKNEGVFILRIEDTDRSRAVPGGIEQIKDTLTWAGLIWDEGPFVQSERLQIYREHAQKLIEKGSAYPCFCTEERLSEMRKKQTEAKRPPMYDGACRELDSEESFRRASGGEPHVIRLKVPREGETGFQDIIHGEVKFQNKVIDDQVLLKSEGFPTYHLANVIDDHLMKISHVIRGDEWISSTPKHILLYNAFEWQSPKFAHLPLLLNADRSKLSKRSGDVSVEALREGGYLPEALLNFTALLGWNPFADREIYSLEELIEHFDLGKINRTGAVVNFEKLKWMNGEYIRKSSIKELVRKAMPWFQKAGIKIEEGPLAEDAIRLARERADLLSELPEHSEFFFKRPEYPAELLRWKSMRNEQISDNLLFAERFLNNIRENAWTEEKLEESMKIEIKKQNLVIGEVLWPMRVALTGRRASPGPFETAAALGKDESLSRIKSARGLI